MCFFQLRHLEDDRLQSAERAGGADAAEGLLLPPRARLRRRHRHSELGRRLLRLLRPQHSLPLSGQSSLTILLQVLKKHLSGNEVADEFYPF